LAPRAGSVLHGKKGKKKRTARSAIFFRFDQQRWRKRRRWLSYHFSLPRAHGRRGGGGKKNRWIMQPASVFSSASKVRNPASGAVSCSRLRKDGKKRRGCPASGPTPAACGRIEMRIAQHSDRTGQKRKKSRNSSLQRRADPPRRCCSVMEKAEEEKKKREPALSPSSSP